MTILSKIVPLFILPLGLINLLGLAALFSLFLNKIRVAKYFLIVQILILWISSIPACSEYMVSLLEQQYLPVAISDSPTADVVVVLGGVVEGIVSPRVEEDLSVGANRVLHALRLLKAGKARKIIVVGGNSPWSGEKEVEATVIKSLLIEWGADPDSVLAAGRSRNTYENALEAKGVLRLLDVSHVLLVTSAMHMPRALAVFHSVGIDAIPSPTDFEAANRGMNTVMDYLPDATALALTTELMRELIGFMYYKLKGWIK